MHGQQSIKIYIEIYIKTSPTYFGATVTPSTGSTLMRSLLVFKNSTNVTKEHFTINVFKHIAHS